MLSVVSSIGIGLRWCSFLLFVELLLVLLWLIFGFDVFLVCGVVVGVGVDGLLGLLFCVMVVWNVVGMLRDVVGLNGIYLILGNSIFG